MKPAYFVVCPLLALCYSRVQAQSDASELGRRARNQLLIEAVRRGDDKAVAKLLEQGANPNAQEILFSKPSLADRLEGNKPYPGDTALMIAAGNGYQRVANLLLERGADVNGRGQVGYTPLFEAVRDVAMTKLLLDHGAKPDLRNHFGDTAIIFAANIDKAQVVDLLLKRGANINGGSGVTPLIEAARSGSEEVVRLFLKSGADPNFRRHGYGTALDYATSRGLPLTITERTIAESIRSAGGKTDPKTEAVWKARSVRRENEARLKEAENHTKALKFANDRILTPEDRAVIEIAMLDVLVADRDNGFFWHDKGKEVRIFEKTSANSLYDSDNWLNGDLDVKQANDISLAMRENLQRRNLEPASLLDLRPTVPQISIVSEKLQSEMGDFTARNSEQGVAYVGLFLPGYSVSHDKAVVRFFIGPSAHGATGTYFLIKVNGKWIVKWRKFAFYA